VVSSTSLAPGVVAVGAAHKRPYLDNMVDVDLARVPGLPNSLRISWIMISASGIASGLRSKDSTRQIVHSA